MNPDRFFALIIVFSMLCLTSGPAFADPKPWPFSWWESHWDKQDFQPYIDEAKHPHNSQWDKHPWQAEDWVRQRPDAMTLLTGFYDADILREQYMDGGTPVVVVGPGFYMLGGHDKRRVMESVDHVYGITQAENGVFMLEDWRTEKQIGSYTRYGLQLQ